MTAKLKVSTQEVMKTNEKLFRKRWPG